MKKLLLLSSLLCVGWFASPVLAAPMTMLGVVGTSTPVLFDVVLPLRDPAGLAALVAKQHDPSSPDFHHWLTPAQVANRFGPDASKIAAVEQAMRAGGLAVTTTGRLVHVSGTAGAVRSMLGTSLAYGRTATGTRHVFATRMPSLPAAVRDAGGIILGLGSDLHEARPLSRRVAISSADLASPKNRTRTTGGYWYNDLKQAYQYPSYQTMITVNGKQQRLDGTGATIGIVMSADILDSDVDAVFDHEDFRTNSGQARNPHLFKRVPVNGGGSLDSTAFGEASLDVQEALTGAPGSHVILYSMPTLSDSDILAAYFRVVNDNEADIVSSSFGACELFYTPAYNNGVDDRSQLQLEHEIFLQGNAQGISFIASSGDEAGLECPSANYATTGANGRYVPSVSVPAADAAVTAVGGTNVVTRHVDGSLDSAYQNENAYSDPLLPEDPYNLGGTVSGGAWGPGGGLSQIVARPDYQAASGVNTGSTTMRALPDIGMQVGGCPSGTTTVPCNGGNSPLNGNGNTDRSYVIIAEQGSFTGLIGTSVAAPEFAGAAALLVERYGRMGNLNPYIYRLAGEQTASGSNAAGRATTAFHRNIPGFNGVVTNNQPVNVRGAYYNYTVGTGTPIVYRFVGAADAAPAGLPRSPSNP